MKNGFAVPVTDAGRRRTKEPLKWMLDEVSGKLSVTGQGPVPDYTREKMPAWSEFREEIRCVEIGEGVTRVGSRAFAGCTNLEKVVLADSVKRIGEQSFSGCTALREIATTRELCHVYRRTERAGQGDDDGYLWASIRAFENTAFGAEVFGEFFICGNTLVEYFGSSEDVTIPEGIREIGYMAFVNKPITSVVFPKSLEAIRAFAFRGTKLKEVVLTAGITRIDEYAFSENHALTRVLICKKSVSISPNAFAGTPVYSSMLPSAHRKWPSADCFGAGDAIGGTGIHPLLVKRREGTFAAIKYFSVRKELLSLLRDNFIIFRIQVNHSLKKVELVKAFARNSDGIVFSYVLYPCEEDGNITKYRDKYDNLYDFDIRCMETSGIRTGNRKRRFWWYFAPYSQGDVYRLSFELLRAWLKENPRYHVRSCQGESPNGSE